ncbi:MAG: U32 family peptidase [Lachnospiraceae bacterium]
MNRKIEILAPAGSYESLKAAICAGADAIYVGGSQFGARAYAKNLAQDDMLQAIDYVHIHGRKIYLTVNTLLKDDELNSLYEYLLPFYQQGLDGVIVQDVGVVRFLKKYFPDLAIHASTQMTITNQKGAEFWKNQGIVRVVPARELSLSEIRKMKEETGLEIECFVHGALCYCYSGQCLLSSMIGGRSGNRGQCAQPCRLPYSVEGQKPADIMSLKDLCTIDFLPELIEAGIDSFKIEGRMKQPDYVYTVVSVYRKYTDLYFAEGASGYKVLKSDREKLLGAYQRRGYSDGYYRQHNGKNMISFQRPTGNEEVMELPEYKTQEKINGKLILSFGESAKLFLEYGDWEIVCEGAAPDMAKRQPLDKKRVEKQMRKTGNTQFIFDRFDVEIEGAVFLPMQALNELRREGIEKLSVCILEKYRRDIPQFSEIFVNEKNVASSFEATVLSALVQSVEQLEFVIQSEIIKNVYVDSAVGMDQRAIKILEEKAQNQKYYLAMPYIFRENTIKNYEKKYPILEQYYDGVLIRNWESYQWLIEHGFHKEIRSDHNMYVFNHSGRAFLQEQGIDQFTAPVELNDWELDKLGIDNASLIVYGYQPVMVTANCIQKTSGKCLKEEGYLSIRDRYQKKFTVKRCCQYCYNIIYNSAPLFLADKAEEIQKLAPAELRMDFTTETCGQMQKIVECYQSAFLEHQKVSTPETEFTRGHFKRGVK